jgi:hypothetical protein
MIMIKKTLTLLGTVAVLLMAIALPAQARQPLRGDMDLQFNLAWSGPSDVVPIWVGTITIDGADFGMAFFNTGTGKPFEDNPSDVLFFEETWSIYDDLEFSFDDEGALATFEPRDIVLSGYDRGIVTPSNSKYHMNGDVRIAEGQFSEWLGRSVHMSGHIEWYPFGAPQYAPGTFRIN